MFSLWLTNIHLALSVGNSSVIDNVLHGIIDVIFGFVLTLAVLTMVKLNPWPLLVSMSTLLVTSAFAVGPSIAKAIEVRRCCTCFGEALCSVV